MAAPRSPQAVLRSGARGEAGFSLIELLLSSTLLIVVLGATLSVAPRTTRRRVDERSSSIRLKPASPRASDERAPA